jgi:hypothetical protein
MNGTRRWFLQLAAHVPFLGALLKPKWESVTDQTVRPEHISFTGRFNSEPSPYIDERITWIPVTERLPQLDVVPPKHKPSDCYRWSRAVMICYDGLHIPHGEHRLTGFIDDPLDKPIWGEIDSGIAWDCHRVSHWAELPNGPHAPVEGTDYLIDNGEACGVRFDGVIVDGHNRAAAVRNM